MVAAIGLLAVTGYLYGVKSLYAFTPYSSMAVHTALAFVVLATGILSARVGPGPLQILTSEGMGGRMARRLLPFAIVAPLTVGWLRLLGQQAGYYGFEVGLAIFATSNVMIFSVLIWLTAVWINRTDAAVRESGRRYRELIESLPQLVWTCQADGPCDYLSPQWVAYTGIPEATQLGYGWLEQIHPEDRERTIAGWKATAGVGLSLDIEFRIRRHDGVYRWFQTRAEPLRNRSGRIAKWFGTNTDIDDRKQVEQALATEAGRRQSLLANAQDGIFILDQDFRVIETNASFAGMLGRSMAETQGLQPWDWDVIYPTEAILRATWPELPASPARFESQIRHRNGTVVEVEISGSPVPAGKAGERQMIFICRDITERKHTQAALAQMNVELEKRVEARTQELSQVNENLRGIAAQLQAAQHISHVGSWEFDVASGRVHWSDELFRIVGLDPAGAAPNYEDQATMFAPESWVTLQKAIAHTITTGEGYELQLEIIRPDGARRWTVARAEATRGAGGEVVRLSGTLQDLTELRRTQIELERLTSRMKLATRAGNLGVWDWSVADNRLVWDDTMYQLYGISSQAFSGAYEAWCSAVHPEDRAAAEAALNDAVDGRAEFDTVFRIIRPDGRVRYIQAAALVHRDAAGKALHMAGINADITEQREAVQALHANEQLLREFVAHAPAAIAMLDLEMCYLQVSERWLADYKLVAQDIIGRSHYEVFPDIPEPWKQIHQRVLAGAVERCDDDPFPRADGGMEWLQWEARPWHRADGSIGGLIFFTQVITARKQMELQLKEQKDQLERSNRDLEQFAYVASHDLQEPLRAVTGCVQILQRRYTGKLDAGADELIMHTVEGAGRMQTLILDLLAYSRVGTERAVFAPAASATLLTQALANLQTAIKETGATVTAGPLPTVRVDPGQLTQLFQNLVGNALKYRSSRPAEIRVEAVRAGPAWKFSVRDNGIGIEPKYFERIFVLFQRLHTRSEYPGTGIGLALCKKIVERHGGRIEVESVPGQGSVFSFTIPTADQP